MQVKLRVLSGTHEGKEIKVQDEKFFIGRGESCQLRPKSESISRKHCALVQKDGRLLALDLKSRNGTFVNDKQVAPDKAKIIKSGDRLRVGQLEFEVLIEVGLGGTKAPEVKDVKQAAERIAAGSQGGGTMSGDSRDVEMDINAWLEEADQVDRKSNDDPATRQFTFEDSSRLDMTIAATNDETTEVSAESKPEVPAKKGPIKLPKMVKGPSAENTRDAANQTLKKYFGGGR